MQNYVLRIHDRDAPWASFKPTVYPTLEAAQAAAQAAAQDTTHARYIEHKTYIVSDYEVNIETILLDDMDDKEWLHYIVSRVEDIISDWQVMDQVRRIKLLSKTASTRVAESVAKRYD